MKSLFVMDPLDRINVAGDSTYVTMRESCDRGYPCWYCVPERMFAVDGVPMGRVTPVKVIAAPPHFVTGSEEERPLGDFDVVWMRKDPPYDMSYVLATWVLDLVPRPTIVVNDPGGLKLYNEKLFAMRFAKFHPHSLLSRDMKQIRAFVDTLPDRAVLKPWNGNGGRGVVVTSKSDRNLGALLEILTNEGRDYLIAQQYVPGISKGDKRVLLFEGDAVAGILRVPSDKDHRGNMHVGARVEPCDLSPRDMEICKAIGPDLRRAGLVFVGIDIIDGYLTEINVTSPTGIQEANRLYDLKLEKDLVDRVERRVAEARATT
jgi:glutathione synthase